MRHKIIILGVLVLALSGGFISFRLILVNPRSSGSMPAVVGAPITRSGIDVEEDFSFYIEDTLPPSKPTSACTKTVRGAFGYCITSLKEKYVRPIVRAVTDLRRFTEADVLIVVMSGAAQPAAMANLQRRLKKFDNVFVSERTPGFTEEELPEKVRLANRVNSNCCGWSEFLKLVFWNMTAYNRIVVLDLDVRLLRNIDHLFGGAPGAGCGLVGDDGNDALFAPGPGTPWNGGFFVVTPKPTLLTHMLSVLRNADYDDVQGWNGAGPGRCVCHAETCTQLQDSGNRTCHGLESLQGFLYYFFQQRGEGTVRAGKLSACHYDIIGCRVQEVCKSEWRRTQEVPFSVHKPCKKLIAYFESIRQEWQASNLKNDGRSFVTLEES